MLLGYNTNGLQNHRLDDALHLLADEGYQAVGLTLDVQHLDPFRSSAKDVDAIAALLARLNLHPTIETGARFVLDPRAKHEPTLMTRDVAARARRLDYFGRAAAIGKDLGASVVSFFSGIDRGPTTNARQTLRDGVAAACEVIASTGMTPALEPEPGMAVETVPDYLDLCAELAAEAPVGADGPALCLDVGHLYVTGEGEPREIVPQVADRIVQVHLEDMRRGIHDHLVPGEGDVDFPAVAAALRSGNYAGPVCFELSRQSHLAPEALRICRTVWEAAIR